MLAGSEIVQLFKELKSLDPYNVPPPSWMETPSPHKMAVNLLIKGYSDFKHLLKPESFIYYKPEHRKNFCMLLLKLIQYPDMSYADMYQLLRLPCYNIDPAHLEYFDKAMARMANSSVEQAFDFAEICKKDPTYDEDCHYIVYSITGIYMRRVQAVLDRMTFPEIYEVHQSFCNYYAKGIRALALGPTKINAFMYNEEEFNCTSNSCSSSCTYDEHCSVVDCNECDDMISYSPATTPASPVQTECQDQCALSSHTIMDTPSLAVDRHASSKWSEKQAELFVQQHSQLLETNEMRALPAPELHKKVCEIVNDTPLFPHVYYLGYMNQLRVGDYFAALEALHRAFDRCPGNLIRSIEQSGFQYFSLSMAKLQAYFGHKAEASKVLKECVMLAQEDVDQHCLDLAQSWFTLLHKKKLDSSYKYLPDIEDEVLVDEFSLALLNILKTGAKWGYEPLGTLDLLAQCEEINRQYSLIQRSIDVLQLRSALWCLYGCADLSALYAQMVMHLEKTWLFGDVSNVDSVCKALATIARHLHVQGATQISQVIISHARLRFSHYPTSNSWMLSDLLNQAQSAIYRCDWDEAEHFISQLFVFERNTSLLLRLHMAIARRNWALAHRVLSQLKYEPELSLQQIVHLLVLKGYSYGMSLQGVPCFLQAKRLAKNSFLVYEHALVQVHLAQLFLLADMKLKAYQICMTGMGGVLQSGGLYERNLALFVFLRCRLAVCETDEERVKTINRAVCTTVPGLLASFRRLQAHAKVLDVLSFLSSTYDALGYSSQRNKYAAQFRLYYNEFPNGGPHMAIPL